MTMRTITTLYDNYDDAVKTVQDLEAEGIAHDAISLIANNAENRYQATHDANAAGTGAEAGATVGGALGGGAGLLAGLGILVIPGIGPVVAAGWLLATVVGAVAGASAGAATGGLVGSLTAVGVSEAHANVYAEGVRRGGTLVTARVDADVAALVESIMSGRHPVDPNARGDAFRETDWTSFDASATPYDGEEMARERARYLGEAPV
jgi:hypothetical protein